MFYAICDRHRTVSPSTPLRLRISSAVRSVHVKRPLQSSRYPLAIYQSSPRFRRVVKRIYRHCTSSRDIPCLSGPPVVQGAAGEETAETERRSVVPVESVVAVLEELRRRCHPADPALRHPTGRLEVRNRISPSVVLFLPSLGKRGPSRSRRKASSNGSRFSGACRYRK